MPHTISFPHSLRKAAIEAVALTLGLYPVLLFGRLVASIEAEPLVDHELQRYPVYFQIMNWMNSVPARSMAAVVALIFFGFFIWLAYLSIAKTRNGKALSESTLIPRLFLKLAIPSTASLLAFGGGLSNAYAIMFVVFAVGFFGNFLVSLSEGKVEA